MAGITKTQFTPGQLWEYIKQGYTAAQMKDYDLHRTDNNVEVTPAGITVRGPETEYFLTTLEVFFQHADPEVSQFVLYQLDDLPAPENQAEAADQGDQGNDDDDNDDDDDTDGDEDDDEDEEDEDDEDGDDGSGHGAHAEGAQHDHLPSDDIVDKAMMELYRASMARVWL